MFEEARKIGMTKKEQKKYLHYLGLTQDFSSNPYTHIKTMHDYYHPTRTGDQFALVGRLMEKRATSFMNQVSLNYYNRNQSFRK